MAESTPDGDDLAELRALAQRLSGDNPARPDNPVPPGASESETESEVGWEQPPPEVWDRIAAAVEGASRSGSDGPVQVRVRSGGRRRSAVLAAAAALVVVGLIGFVVVRDRGDAVTVVASVPLRGLGEDEAEAGRAGEARLVEVDGRLQLEVSVEGLEAGDGFLEVWVIDTEVSRLISLGPLRGDGVHELPAGLDPAAFPVVDVSVEPFDGDPTHSGDSVLRGQLSFS